jgi:hypothetical protein
MNLNVIFGIFLLTISTATIAMSFLIAFKQYVSAPKTQAKVLTSLPDNPIQLFLQLTDDVFKAPPALAYLVAGIFISAAGIWLLVIKPI